MTNDEKKALLCALVDGKQLQFLDIDGEWNDAEDCGDTASAIFDETKATPRWRIAPERVVRYIGVKADGQNSALNMSAESVFHRGLDRIRCTWEDGKLISAEVVE